MKSLNINAILPWELGLIIIIISLAVIILGVRQSRRTQDDFDDIPLTKATTKIFFGSFTLIFGSIQLLPLLNF
jgi:cell division protein FtsW (lipid II flippase)